MTERVRKDQLHGDWLKRLPHYLFVLDLIEGRRVLELGCGSGSSTQFLANHGAAQVVGVDDSGDAIDRARAAYRLSNLSFHQSAADAIQLEDASIDTVFWQADGHGLRRDSVLRELRRLLVADGTLICSVASADRPAAAGGVSYHELIERLSPLFSPIRMAAETPFLGTSLVEFDGPPEPPVELDTSLLDLAGSDDEEVTHYLAICGGGARAGEFRGFTIVQMPSTVGHAILGADMAVEAATTVRVAESDGAALAQVQRERDAARRELAAIAAQARQSADEVIELRDKLAMVEEQLELSAVVAADASDDSGEPEESTTADEWPPAPVHPDGAAPYHTAPTRPSMSQQVIEAMAVHADHVRDLELELDERQAYIDELRDQLSRAKQRNAELGDRLHAAEARGDSMRAELNEWRTKASVAAGEVMRLRAGGKVAAPADDAAQSARVAEAERQRDEALAKLSRATENWKAAEAKSDEIWRKVGELQTQLEAQREASQDAAKKARSQAQVALARAMDDSSKKLVSVQDRLLKAERQRDQLEAKVGELQAQVTSAGDGAEALALSEVTSLRVAVAQLEDEVTQGRELLRTLQAGLEKLAAAKPAGLPSSDLALQLGIRDAELTLMNVGVASLQRKLDNVIEQVSRARKDMDGQEPAQMVAIVDALARALASGITG